MIVSQTKIFGKQKKKLLPNQIKELDKAINEIAVNPLIGSIKKGDLQGVRVYKFKLFKQECLLAYTISRTTIFLLCVGMHENFYRDLKKTL